MIVLPSISQNVYIIDNTRFTCYNNYENREIAKILLSEEYAQLNINNLTFQNRHMNMTIKELKDVVDKQKSYIADIENINNKLKVDNKKYITDNIELENKINKYKPYVISSVVLNIVLIIIVAI